MKENMLLALPHPTYMAFPQLTSYQCERNFLQLLWSLDFVKVTHYCRPYAAPKDKRCHTLCTDGARQHCSPLCSNPNQTLSTAISAAGSRPAPRLRSVIAADQQLAICPALRDQMQPSILMALGSITICKDSFVVQNNAEQTPSFLPISK